MDNIVSRNAPLTREFLSEGAAILIDKPLEWTSFDVVNKLRFSFKHLLGVKKYKVGHAGTLDPLATGLLIVCISKYTKKIEQLIGYNKEYEALIQLGASTPTYDAEALPDIYYPFREITKEKLEDVNAAFLGKISQVPPMYSAIKVKGTPLYKLARRGKEVKREPRQIHISQLELGLVDKDQIFAKVRCSKGTYIRSLAYDIGKKLGTGGYLKELRRTAIGEYSVQDALTIDNLIDQVNQLNT